VARALVAYFSITGTTATVAESVACGLRRAGFCVEIAEIVPGPSGPLPRVRPGEFDLLAVGTPAHYYRPPSLVREWIAALPPMDGLPTLAFVLYALDLGASGNRLRRQLTQRGCAEVGYLPRRGFGCYLPYVRRGYRFSPEHPTDRELATAEEWALAASTRPLPAAPPDGRTHWENAVVRAVLSPMLVRHFYAARFSSDSSRCARCGACARTCPMSNISRTEDGAPVWGRSCLLCFECQLRYPNEAVRSPADWRVFAPFISYDVRRGRRDLRAGFMRVRLERGKIVPLD
jgi:flavodoxin/NAD-dependent dihydropyrimidine dehydrogenase PreA subunit